jgi:ATP-dependent Clp protease ATP-binding subunit ClpA
VRQRRVMYERFSVSARVAVTEAFNVASRHGDSTCHTGHLLIALITTSARDENAILRFQVFEADTIAKYLADECEEQPYRSVWRLFRRVDQSAAFAETITAAVVAVGCHRKLLRMMCCSEYFPLSQIALLGS